jgi:hypothetical protein
LSARTQRIALTAGALAITAMIMLLALTLVDIERQRRIAARQETRIESLIGSAQPDIADVRKGLQQGLPPLRNGLLRADGLVRALVRRDGPQAIAAAGELARDLTAGHRAAGLVDRGTDLLVQLQRSDAVGDVDTVAQATTELLALSRELAQIGRDTGEDVDVVRTQTIRFKRHSLRIQRATLAILRRSLTVQEETLVHARNIDRRTGGALEPASG